MRILLVSDEAGLVTTMAERLSLRETEEDWVTSDEKALLQRKRWPMILQPLM